jgi:hypothetical protein
MTDKRMRGRGIAATLIALTVAAGAAAEKPQMLADTGTFRAAFESSFYGFDICGDTATGALYRKALIEKVDHCPFTADAKAGYRRWSTDTETRKTAETQRYIAEHDKLPERLDRWKLNCRTERDNPVYQTTVALLAGYGKGEVGYNAVVPDACDAKAGAP